jgi:hypothetical protein
MPRLTGVPRRATRQSATTLLPILLPTLLPTWSRCSRSSRKPQKRSGYVRRRHGSARPSAVSPWLCQEPAPCHCRARRWPAQERTKRCLCTWASATLASASGTQAGAGLRVSRQVGTQCLGSGHTTCNASKSDPSDKPMARNLLPHLLDGSGVGLGSLGALPHCRLSRSSLAPQGSLGPLQSDSWLLTVLRRHECGTSAAEERSSTRPKPCWRAITGWGGESARSPRADIGASDNSRTPD